MTPQQLILAGVIVFNIVLIWILRLRPELRVATGGKVLAFVALFGLPVLTFTGGAAHHLERATSTEFCLSCHVMEPYGRSLKIDSRQHVPAFHV